MESEQTTNQKCLSFLDHAAEQQRKKLSESLEEEFEKLIIAEGYDINGGGDTSSLKENDDEERMMTRSQTKMKKPTSSSSKGEIKRTVKPNRAQLLRNAQMEKVLWN